MRLLHGSWLGAGALWPHPLLGLPRHGQSGSMTGQLVRTLSLLALWVLFFAVAISFVLNVWRP